MSIKWQVIAQRRISCAGDIFARADYFAIPIAYMTTPSQESFDDADMRCLPAWQSTLRPVAQNRSRELFMSSQQAAWPLRGSRAILLNRRQGPCKGSTGRTALTYGLKGSRAVLLNRRQGSCIGVRRQQGPVHVHVPVSRGRCSSHLVHQDLVFCFDGLPIHGSHVIIGAAHDRAPTACCWLFVGCLPQYSHSHRGSQSQPQKVIVTIKVTAIATGVTVTVTATGNGSHSQSHAHQELQSMSQSQKVTVRVTVRELQSVSQSH